MTNDSVLDRGLQVAATALIATLRVTDEHDAADRLENGQVPDSVSGTAALCAITLALWLSPEEQAQKLKARVAGLWAENARLRGDAEEAV